MSMSEELLRRMQADAARLRQTELREVPGGIPGFTSFYDSGTFTPVFKGNGTAGTWAYSVQAGFWERIGRRVFFSLNLGAASRSVAPTGSAIIDGLPLTSVATANSHSAVALDTLNALTLSGTVVQITARIPPSTTFIELIEVTGTAPSVAAGLAATGLGTTPFVRASGSYLVG